jgi:hypothetical protein
MKREKGSDRGADRFPWMQTGFKILVGQPAFFICSPDWP